MRSLRASGGQVRNGNEGSWRSENVAERRDREGEFGTRRIYLTERNNVKSFASVDRVHQVDAVITPHVHLGYCCKLINV